VEHWFNKHQINVDIVAESQDIAVKKMMAIDGLGLIAAGSHSVKRQLKNGELIEVGKLKGVTESLYILTVERKNIK
jgi:DNA-binding transcriptional LysR family regulator